MELEQEELRNNNLQNNFIRPMVAPVPELPGQDFFKYRIEGIDILEEIEHQLKGEIYDPNQKGYVPKFDCWMNDDGISKVLHIIYACGINKNIFLGNLTKEEILYKCRSVKKKLALLLFKKYKEYGVKREMRDLLITTIVNTIHSALSRSEGGRESEQISTAAQRHDIYQYQQQQEKSRGFIDKLPFINRRSY